MRRLVVAGFLILVVAGAGGWFLARPGEDRHCLLLFGKGGEQRISVIVAGQRISLAREDSQGQLFDIGRYSKFDDCRDVDVSDSGNQVRYLIERVSGTIDPKQPRPALYVTVRIMGPVTYRETCDVEL